MKMAFLRPVIAGLLVFAYLAMGAAGTYLKLIDGNTFLTSLGSMVGMVVAFLFGERAALKRPGDSSEG
jgi:hypothetical protein